MTTNKTKVQKLREHIHEHIHQVWPERTLDFFSWELGPITKSMPDFRVARVEPNSPGQSWIYLSVGLSEVVKDGGCGMELFLLSPWEEALHVELFAMLVNYCCDPAAKKLEMHGIFDIGRPWIEGSHCDHFLVSLPYTIGPRVEWLECGDGQNIRVLWILPITSAEASFAKQSSVEDLERKFDQAKINPVDPFRTSVV